jgi:transcriptional regulator with XRE-family HTH domain
MSQAGLNLKYLRKLRGLTQEEFANKVGIKRSLVGAYEEERADPRLEVLEVISEMFKLSLDELLLKDLSAESDSYLMKRRKQKLFGSGAEERKLIHFVPVKAAAGYLAGYADADFIDELNTFTLPMLSGGNYRAFEIIGDSMLPTPSGSIIVGEKVESFSDAKHNEAYIVVSRNEGIVYKRLQINAKQKAKVTLLSDNPQYQPYQVNAEDIVELWHAEVVIGKVASQQRWDMNSLANIVTNLQSQVSNLKKKMN